MKGGWAVRVTERFAKDYKRLPVDIRRLVDDCINDLALDPIPNSRRPHSISPAGRRPQVFSLDVTTNKAYKLSFELDGNCAVLRRVGTHREIDRLA